MKGARRVLYKLPELLAADRAQWVFIPEGEKDVDNLFSIGLVATCNAGGGGKWKTVADDSALHGRRVCIIADRDKPGRAHAEDVAAQLTGKAADVRIIEMPGDGVKDATDWIEGLDSRTPEELAAGVLGMADAAPAWESKVADAGPPVPLPGKIIESRAFWLLTGISVQVLVACWCKYGDPEQEFPFSCRWAKRHFDISAAQVARALRQLCDFGFLRCVHAGGGGEGEPSRYRLTDKWRTFTPPPKLKKFVQPHGPGGRFLAKLAKVEEQTSPTEEGTEQKTMKNDEEKTKTGRPEDLS